MWDMFRQRALLIREPNEVRILRLVRDHGYISRIEIARSCNLNKAYVTDLVNRLIKAGFLEETDKVAESDKVGRKKILLRFRPLAGIVAGIDIQMTHATVAITDLNASLINKETINYLVQTTAQEVIEKITIKIREMLAASNFSQSQLVGIGIGVQGVIDYSTNTLMISHNKKNWEGESLSSDLEEQFNVPVYVENDVKTMALGEYLLGSAKGTKTFVHIWIGDGLGAGMMINGHLHRGITSSAGEIGYTSLESPSFCRERFPILYNGQEMFSEILRDPNIIDSYKRKIQAAKEEDIGIELIAERASKGEPVAMQIVEEYCSLLNILSITIVNMLNPEMIIIGGKLAQCYPKIAEILQQKLHQDLLLVPAEAVKVRTAKHGVTGGIFGAVGLVLYELFEPLHSLSLRATQKKQAAKPRVIDVE